MANLDQIINKINDGTMKSLNLSNNNIGNEGVISLAKALKENSSITTLDLSYNKIGPEAATALAEAFKVNSTITMVNLRWNNMGDTGATALAEALKENSTIQSVNLFYNNFGATGATALAEALKLNQSIRFLDLSYNKIGPEGATEIADALKVNSTITNLSLNGNNIGPAGATALTEALKVNSTITEFFFLDIHLENYYFYKEFKDDNMLSNELISKLSDIFLQVMIHRGLPENTDVFYLHLSDMQESTLKQNLAKRFFVLQKKNQTQSEKIFLPVKFSPKNKDKQVQTWNKGSIKKKSELQAKQIYDRIHPKNIYFTFDVNKRETVREKEEEIWYKFNEYLSMTNKQLSFDTYVPRKLLLELFELYVDKGIIEFSTEFLGQKKKDYSQKVLRKLNRIVAFQYINILRDQLPVDEIDELKKNLIQEEQKQRTKLNRILTWKDINTLRDELPPGEIDEFTKKYSTSSSTSKQTQKQTSTSTSSSTQKKTQRPYYKKLEKKLFQLHYEKIIDRIIQSNQKKIVNIHKQIEKSKGNQTEKQITQKQIEKRRKTISNIMTNNQRLIKLKQIKNNEMDVIKSQNQSQTQRIQKKILDNMLPETFQLKFLINRKRKSRQKTQGQKQQGQKQSNKKLKIQPDTKTQHRTSTSSSPKQNNDNIKFYQVIYPTRASSSSSFLRILNEKGEVEKTQQFFNPRQLDQKIKLLKQKGYKNI